VVEADTYQEINRDDLDSYMWGNNREDKGLAKNNFMVRLLREYYEQHSNASTGHAAFWDAEAHLQREERDAAIKTREGGDQSDGGNKGMGA
jgi:hypothetical protein